MTSLPEQFVSETECFDMRLHREEWIEAFTKAQGDFPTIGKGSTVNTGTFSYKYAALPDISELVLPVLRRNDLVLVQSVGGTAETIAVETRIYHKAGHVETFGPLVMKVSADPKAVGSAITYARRYALCAALGIAPDEDDDGATASAPKVEAPREVSSWEWLWEESAIFKVWSEVERLEKIKDALSVYAYKTVETREQAQTIMDWLKTQSESAEQAELPV